jgi:hypothetical protein
LTYHPHAGTAKVADLLDLSIDWDMDHAIAMIAGVGIAFPHACIRIGNAGVSLRSHHHSKKCTVHMIVPV